MASQLRPITTNPGVSPSTDTTEQSTTLFTYTDKVRFKDGRPEKIGGWQSWFLDSNYGINGCTRTIYGYTLSNVTYHLIGTNRCLYRLFGNDLFNATPVKTTGTGANNVLATNYGTLGSNPLATVDGSGVITVTDAGHSWLEGDVVTLSGASDTNGILATDINASHTISNVTANTFNITTSGTATSTGSGGGASVVRATRVITVTYTNTYENGDNVSITGASDTGGILAASINTFHEVRNATASTFQIYTSGTATSSVSSAGGSITILDQIDEGLCDPTTGVGYGMGLYGAGLYGVSKSASTPTPISIWSVDRFGDLVVTTRGVQTGVYSWNSATSALPALVTNAPTAVNYVFVSNEICVTLGAGGVGNRIQWSDQGGLTTWTATAQNQAGQDDIEGASEFISQCNVRGVNLLFTRDSVYTFRYVGKPFVWETKRVDPQAGLIGPNARISVNGVAYWMGKNNFYYWDGSNVQILGSNVSQECTALNYVFQNITQQMVDKIFCWFNPLYGEIWWHYPTINADECDRVIRFNITTREWVIDTFNRSAGEYPVVMSQTPFLACYNGCIWQHELGYNDGDNPMTFTLRTPYYNSGSGTAYLLGIVPDSIQTGSLSLTINTKRYPQSTAVVPVGPYTISDTTDKLVYRQSARFWQYEISGSELDQQWVGGLWYEELGNGTPR